MKKRIRNSLALVLTSLSIVFIVTSVRKASRKFPPAEPVQMNTSEMVFYGQVQPAGKAIRMGPKVSGTVQEVLVREGEFVRKGQTLCILDDAVEKKALEGALARVAFSRKAAEMSAEKWTRGEALYRGKSITDLEYIQSKLKKELDEADVAVGMREAELAEVKRNERRVVAPSNGMVYKLDLRPGEAFQVTDSDRILFGSPLLELRCDLEAYWIDRLDTMNVYRVFHAETGEPLGKATYVSASRYLRPKQVQTENPQERMSAVYQEIILRFIPDKRRPPIGLPVMVKMD